MKEKPVFFESDGYKLFGVLHRPTTTTHDLGFVFAAPFFEEKLWAHRIFVNFARELTSRGIPVFRFDYMGHGDSEGEFEKASIKTRMVNLQDAATYLLSATPVRNLGLLGLRFGATLAALEAERAPAAYSHLVLWEPVAKGAAYMQEMLRINLATQMASYKEIRVNRKAMVEAVLSGDPVNVDGYGIAEPLFTEASEIDLLQQEVHFQGKTLLLSVRRQEGPLSKPMEQLASKYPGIVSKVVAEGQFWKEIKEYVAVSQPLFHSTWSWLEEEMA